MELFTGDKKIQQAFKRSEIQELLSYFQKLQAPVILREIRPHFPQQKHLDKNLDFLIDNGIVSRQDRRYQLSLNVVDDYPTSAAVECFLQEKSERYSVEELLVWLGEEFWSNQLEETIAVDFPLATRNCLENQEFRLVSLNRGGALSETLPNYFANSDQPKLFPNLARLIGDVNPEFFTNQVNLLLEQVMAGRAPRRDSIFLKSLVSSQVVAEQPEWHMVIPTYEAAVSFTEVPKLDRDDAFFFARELAERLLDKQESFTYLMKKKA